MISKILLNPGPTNTSFMTKIKQWIGSDKCHREQDFQEKLNNIQKLLKNQVYSNDTGRVAIIAGSGTTAMESMISSIIEDEVVVINAGPYGKRAIDMMSVHKIKHKIVNSKTIDDLQYNDSIDRVYFVENETSSGEKYSLSRMREIYPKAKFYIDATSAFGASEYLRYSDYIIGLSCCSNKCLQSTPGLGIVIWNGTEENKHRSYFGDLSKYGINKLPFTLPTQSLYALEQAIKTSLNNKNIFDSRRDKIVSDLQKMNIACISKNPCNSVIAFKHPNKNYTELKTFLNKKGIVIYSGVEGIDNSFRVSTMSHIFDKKYYKIIRSFT